MPQEIFAPEDGGRLIQYYGIHNKGRVKLSDFIIAVLSQFPCEDPNGYNSFTRYIDSQTHLRMENAGMCSTHENWGERYGLNEESYRCFRNITLEKFAIKTLERLSQGIELKDYELYMDLKKA